MAGQDSENKSKFDPRFVRVTDKYGGFCPDCGVRLFFTEGSFYCPCCGYNQGDYEVEVKEAENIPG